MIEKLAQQYFDDLKTDGRTDNDGNLKAWLWFTCPANLRMAVHTKIESLRSNQEHKEVK